MIYLAGPYSHPDKAIQEYRFQKLTALAGLYVLKGMPLYSPITNSHEIGKYIGGTWELWKDFDTAMLAVCTELHVFQMDGWEESIGVTAEIELFGEVTYIPDMSLTELITGIEHYKRIPDAK